MPANGLFIGFGSSVRGRERQALKMYGEAVGYFSRLQADGQTESFESVALEPHGGDLDGFILLRGDPDKLARIRASEEFERLLLRGELIVDNLAVVGAVLGERLTDQLSVVIQQVEDLT